MVVHRTAVFATVLMVSGAVGICVTSPPYFVSAPDSVAVQNHLDGGSLEIDFINLRGHKVILDYEGDCCSARQKWIVGPFQSKKLSVRFDTSRYGSAKLAKNVTLKMTNRQGEKLIRLPFDLEIGAK